MVWACDANRGILSRKEDGGNGSVREKEERKASAKMVGHGEG